MDQSLAAPDRALHLPPRRPLARVLGVLGAVVLAGALAGCGGGSDGDETSGEDTSKPKTSTSGDDSGGMTIEGDDGSITVDEDDGTVVIEGDDGSATFSGSGTELPEGWPAAVPVVEGTLIYAATTTTDGQSTYSASVQSTSSAADLYSAVRDALTGAGLQRVTETTASDGAFGMFSGQGWDVIVTVGESEGGAAVVYAVTPSS